MIHIIGSLDPANKQYKPTAFINHVKTSANRDILLTICRFLIAERSKKPIELEGSVALVGNSDALLDLGHGAAIDSHDTVMRFNLCDLNPKYKEDIGSKVDYCFFSLNISTNKYPHSKAENLRFVQLCRKSKIICYPNNTKNVRKFARKPYVLAIAFEQINQVYRSLVGPEAIQFPKEHHPRNGIKLLASLIHEGIRPTLYGFDLADRGDNKHYFDDEIQTENIDQFGHQPSREYALLKQLIDKNLIEVI